MKNKEILTDQKYIIIIENISKSFDHVQALEDVSLNVESAALRSPTSFTVLFSYKA